MKPFLEYGAWELLPGWFDSWDGKWLILNWRC